MIICLCRIVDSTVQLIYLSINIYVFLLASCVRPTGPILAWVVRNGQSVNGKYPEGTKVYFPCELGSGSRIIYHPSVCQVNGQWKQTSGCEGISSFGSNRNSARLKEITW